MKAGKFILVLLFVGSLFTYSCKPDNVEPNQNPDFGAFNLAEDPVGDEHIPPDPKCGTTLTGQLYISAQGYTFPLNGTEYLMVNGEDNLFINIKGLPGWVFYESGCNVGAVGSNPPVDANNQTDLTQFTFYKDHKIDNSLQNKRTWRIDMASLEQIQTYSVAAILGRWDFTNNVPIGAPFTVWINGKPVQGPGGFTLDYQLASCPGASCQPWIGAAQPCNPSCAVPSFGPGDDYSEYHCQKGNNPNVKVTVCHVPPGNPANMHDICINESALPAHIIDFKPASNPCLGHHSGCHIGPCDPCGPASSQTSIDAAAQFAADNGCNGSGGNGNGNGKN